MDLHITCIDESGLVAKRYITSSFLGHASAQNLLNSLKSCLPEKQKYIKILKKPLQLSMDGPAVNWKLLDLLQDKLSDTPYKLTNRVLRPTCHSYMVHLKLRFNSLDRISKVS